MKVLQLGKFYPILGGVEKVMYDLLQGLSQRDIDCDMLCAATEKQTPGVISVNQQARVWCMPTWKKVSATMISPAMIVKLRQIHHEYDIIHIHHPDPMACLALFFSGYRGKVVLHWHSDILKQKTLLKLYGPLQRWLIRRADVIAGTTPVYIRHSPFLERVQEKTIAIPIGIEAMASCSPQAVQLRKTCAGKKIIFSLGRLVDYKGYRYLVEAARYLSDEYLVLIGGTGPLQTELQALIDEWQLAGKVRLLGFVADTDVAGYFESCDLFCLSSIWKTEAFGIVQIEAMSFGKPVVATRIPESGVSWVNADGVSGVNVKPQDAKELAKAIATVLSDRQQYERLSTGARERYETLFTREKMVNECLELYNKLLKKEQITIIK